MTTFEQDLADAVQPLVDREIARYDEALTEIAKMHTIEITSGWCTGCPNPSPCPTQVIVDKARAGV